MLDAPGNIETMYQTLRQAIDSDLTDLARSGAAGVINLELYEENPVEWLGYVGCEMLLEVVLAVATAGSSLAVKFADEVADFTADLRRRFGNDNNNGGDGGGPTPRGSLLERSVALNETRRVAWNPDNGEYAVFDSSGDGTYHGHVRPWAKAGDGPDPLSDNMKNLLTIAPFHLSRTKGKASSESPQSLSEVPRFQPCD